MTTPADKLAALPDAFFTAADVPAVSVAVQTNDGSWTRTSKGITPGTLFQAASISKAVAALAALALVDKKVIQLDDDINDRLTSWTLPVSHDWPARVTVRHLLCHGGAISVRSFPGYRQGTPLPSLTDILDGRGNSLTGAIRVTGLPGVTAQYSGGGYTVLQQLIEDVTGKSFAAAVTDLVLTPLGMSGARYGAPGTTPVAPGWMAANPPLRKKGRSVPKGWRVYPELAAAGLWCTPADLVTFGRAIQAMNVQPGPGPGVFPLRKVLARLMLAEEFPGWGLGVELEVVDGARAFGHEGDNEGYSCKLTGTVDPGPVIAVMTASNVGQMVIEPLLEHIRHAVGWPGSPKSSSGISSSPPDQPPSEDELAVLPGLYGGRYEIRKTANTGLQLSLEGTGWNWTLTVPGQPPLPLEVKSAEWLTCPVLPIKIKFDLDPQTRTATGLTLHVIGDEGPEVVRASRV